MSGKDSRSTLVRNLSIERRMLASTSVLAVHGFYRAMLKMNLDHGKGRKNGMKEEQSGIQLFGNQIETGTLPSQVKVPIRNDLSEWPRFDTMELEDVEVKQAGDWVLKFGQLAEAVTLRLTFLEMAIGDEKSAEKRKELRTQKKLWTAWHSHYNTMKGAMSRKLTSLSDEVKYMGLRMRNG